MPSLSLSEKFASSTVRDQTSNRHLAETPTDFYPGRIPLQKKKKKIRADPPKKNRTNEPNESCKQNTNATYDTLKSTRSHPSPFFSSLRSWKFRRRFAPKTIGRRRRPRRWKRKRNGRHRPGREFHRRTSGDDRSTLAGY